MNEKTMYLTHIWCAPKKHTVKCELNLRKHKAYPSLTQHLLDMVAFGKVKINLFKIKLFNHTGMLKPY